MQDDQWLYKSAAKLFILLGVLTLLVLGREFFIPLLIALFFSFLLYPLSKRLERYKFPRALAIILTIIFALICFLALLYFFGSQISSFRDDLPELKKQFHEKGGRILTGVESITKISKEKQLAWAKEKIASSADSGPKVLMGIFSTTGSFLAMFALIPLYIFFITYFREKYKKFIVLVTKEHHEKALDILKKVSLVARKYLKGVFLDIVILAILGSTGYLLLGIKHAILFGVLAAMLNVVPYIGALVGSILPVAMALITKDEISYALGAAGVAVVVQFLDNNFISPYVVGSSVSINPLSAILVLIASALIWGIAGMILSIPIMGMIKVVCDNIESLKPYGYLIGEEVNYKQKRRKKF